MKKRFGISISYENFNDLEQISKRNRVNRSQLVERAIEEYISRLKHEPEPHMCRGVLVLVHGESEHERVEELIEKRLVSLEAHVHDDGQCIRLVYVKGSTNEIERFVVRLTDLKVKTAFLPLHE